MRKFQYVVTLNLDENIFDAEMLEEIKKIEGVSGPDLIGTLASGPMVGGMIETLNKNMGESGESTVEVSFAGEVL